MKKITNPLYEVLHRGIYSKLVYKTFKRQKKVYVLSFMYVHQLGSKVGIQPYTTVFNFCLHRNTVASYIALGYSIGELSTIE